uniref:CCHC-type domain-containing protein n=1 Tax=Oncorhynchus mykiss TaxID=8022 RepID=A0A8C7NNL8_ONCMY
MNQYKQTRSVPGIGMANTLRFAWTENEMEPWSRETFGRTILMGCLRIEVKEVLCLQGNPNEKAFDVTFHKEEKHDEVMKMAKEAEKTGPLCHYAVTSLAKNNFRVVTVTMYNPHVKDEEVRAFLGRYMDNVSSARYLRDSLGFWNGRRGFQALLRESPKSVDGYLHPPAMFSLGADRGTLYYARQPPFCRRCMAYGHILASCSAKKCRFCGSEEHEAKECDEPKACHGCGSRAHLWRDCPARHRSYASAAGGGAGDGGRKERTRADCMDGTGEKTSQEEDGKKDEVGRKRRGEEKNGTEGEKKKGTEEGGGAEKREKGTVVREGVEEGMGTVVREGVEEGTGTVTEKEGGVEVGGEGVVGGGDGGKEWGDSLPGFLEVEMRDLVEGLVGMGRCVSPLPPSPKKKGIKRGSLAGSEREG